MLTFVVILSFCNTGAYCLVFLLPAPGLQVVRNLPPEETIEGVVEQALAKVRNG